MEFPRNGVKWSVEETILAFRLYCQVPFSKISKSTPEVMELARLLGRTPGSVALKMFNLSHFDPELKKRNVTGMSHASKTDEEVFTQFINNWEGLLYRAELIEAEYQKLPIGEMREEFHRTRVNQDFFRGAVLSAYQQTCCITGITEPELLIASHIKPWADSDSRTERTNPRNGLCLNALHDKAFDRGLMTVYPDHTIHFSEQLKNQERSDGTAWLLQFEGQEIHMPDRFAPQKEFLEYHNDVIFKR